MTNDYFNNYSFSINNSSTSSGVYHTKGSMNLSIEGSISNTNGFSDAILSNYNVFKKINHAIGNIEKRIIKDKISNLLSIFDVELFKNRIQENYLPPININTDEDSASLEWIFKDFRVGFTIEEDDDKSMWFLITTRELEESVFSGAFKESDYVMVIKKILKFVVVNS